jgi:FMNH2-dependent dimethyl sulfone monooxygenase
MDAGWDYLRRLAMRSEKIGFDVTFIPESNVEAIKPADAPALDAWSTAAALAAITRRLEFIVSARPGWHQPMQLARQAATLDRISGGRLSLHLAPTTRSAEARQIGLPQLSEEESHRRAAEWLAVVDGLWRQDRLTFDGEFYRARDAVLMPKPLTRPRPAVYGDAESEAGRLLVARQCDGCLLRGDSPERVARRIADIRLCREQADQPPLIFAMTAFVVLRDTEREALDEVQRITDVKQTSASYRRYQQWVANGRQGDRLRDSAGLLADFAVSHGGLRAGLIGTREQIAEQVARFERAGVNLLLVQCSPQFEEMDRFASAVIADDQQDVPGASWSSTA